MKLVKSLLLTLILTSFCWADEKPVLMGAQNIEIAGKSYLAVYFQNAPHWHTYWKNPGDAGIPITSTFKLAGKTMPLKPLEWPAPKKYLEKGNLLGIGYDHEYAFFYPLEGSFLQSSAGKTFSIHSEWLVCKHICVPGDASLKGKITDGRIRWEKPADLSWKKEKLVLHFENLPQKREWPGDLKISLNLAKDKKNLVLHYSLNVDGPDKLIPYLNILTPFLQEPFAWKKEELFYDGKGRMFAKLFIEWDGEYMEPTMPLPEDGKFGKPFELHFLFADPQDGKTFKLSRSFSGFSLQKDSVDYGSLTKIAPSYYFNAEEGEHIDQKATGAHSPTNKDEKSLLFYILFAMLGGFILNFMPCVLPVISIKLFGLINHQGLSRSKILKHNLAYSLGIFLTFFILGSVIVALKLGGEEVGWGFQLQSPSFVAIMIIGLFIFSLNLFGLFEFRTPAGNKLGGAQLKEGFAGDVLSGVIAVILSTPCSAPFLGTALTFAFTSHFSMIYVIFLAVGFGLALPFLFTGLFPKMIAFLPKPGMWMEDLKKFLGLTLLLTTVWLIDVFQSLVNVSTPNIILNTLLVFLFFGLYAFQKMQLRKFWKIFYALTPLIFVVMLFKQDFKVVVESTGGGSQLLQEKQAEGLPWEAWNPNALETKKQQKRLVFMDFTAKWCFTCKVNEKLVLNTKGFKALIKKYDVDLLLADWTKRDNIIGGWLKSHGKVGVPAYFVQTPTGELIDLGETITLSKIEKAFQKAK